MSYNPRPIDTSQVKLSPRILALTELLAANAHDVWARARMAEGWTHGLRRDDDQMTNPCLVPYGQLPESEKEHNRKAALQTIRAICALGYRLDVAEVPYGEDAGAIRGGAEAADLLNLFQDHRLGDLGLYLGLWQTRRLDKWSKSNEIYKVLTQRFLQLGEPLLAYDVAAEGLGLWPRDVRLRQLTALSLLRSRATEKAMSILQELYTEGHGGEETLGLMARAQKDLAERAVSLEQRNSFLTHAYKVYRKAYETTGGYYSGINAATLARVLGDAVIANEFAGQVRRQCLAELPRAEQDGQNLYWIYATLAESALIRGEWDEAEKWYTTAVELGRQRFGDIATTRRNARLLLTETNADPRLVQRIDQCFSLPRVVVFSGHMVDLPGRIEPRFPAALAPVIKQAIGDVLHQLNGRIGFASAACGSDILFLENILELGGEIQVILPFPPEQFIKESVAVTGEGNWPERFDQVIKKAKDVIVASEQQLEGDGGLVFDYANLLLLGLSRIRARQLDTDLCPLAVWDGRPGDGYGGTASAVGQWKKAGLKVQVIDLGKYVTLISPNQATEAGPKPGHQEGETISGVETQIKAMLFADAVGFSKLSETQVALFARHFLGAVAGLIKPPYDHAPLYKDTWGDGLFFVFSSAREAGLFALEMCDLVTRTDWQAKGLPEDMNFRVALHSGPVYNMLDPLTDRPCYFGIHVIRTARMEPVTPPGQVYASREFAALAAVENVKDFTLNYAGQTPLAKEYGIHPVYHLQRAAPLPIELAE